jgi:4-hydroxybenzoate polyprenyltransferase
MFRKLSESIRTDHWWQYKASHLLGFTYLFFCLIKPDLKTSLHLLLLSSLTIIGIAGLGYFINDYYDIEFDNKVGKRNRVGEISLLGRLGLLLLLTLVAFIPWFFLRSNIWIWIFIGIEFILLIGYSHPLTRIKEKSVWGLICDALYGHALPVIIACLTYWQYYNDKSFQQVVFFSLIFLWQFQKGLRNILLHQLDDYENDINSGIKTYTTAKDPIKITQLIKYRFVPLEIIWTIIFIVLLINDFPYLIIGFLFFLFINFLGHGMFRIFIPSKENEPKNTFLFFLNDWYEDYIPWIFLTTLVMKNNNLWPIALAHLILFPNSLLSILVYFKRSVYQLYLFLPIIKAIIFSKK